MRTHQTTYPKMTVGRYAGTPVDKLPHSYLRWVITQSFPKEILDAALAKLEQSDYNSLFLNVSRHALDMFSKRFLGLWISSEGHKEERAVGIASFVAMLAAEAWDKGKDISKHRHKDDGIIKEYQDIRWVFAANPNSTDYLDVITVMSSTED